MGSTVHFSGEISINPPLTWPEIKDGPWLGANDYTNDACLKVVEEQVDTEEGTFIHKTATAIVNAVEDEARGYHFEEDVQAMVDLYGDGRTFVGFIEAECPDYMERWRIYVRDGRAVRVEPVITWPDEP